MGGRRLKRATPAAHTQAASAVDRLRAAVEAHTARHKELVDILRVLCRPGGDTRWSSLRRLLRLAGHGSARRHHVVLALLEVSPDAHLGRGPPRGRGHRIIIGVQLAARAEALRNVLAQRWEEKLRAENMPPELVQIAMEYKLAPTGSEHHGRLADLVIRAHLRRTMASHYYGVATDYLHDTPDGAWAHFGAGHKRIWALHCEGATKEEISEETGVSETTVQSILDFHRARAGLVHR